MSEANSKRAIYTGVLVACLAIAAVVIVVRMDTTGQSGNGLGETFTYSVTDWIHSDPSKIGFVETDAIPTDFTNASAIAVDAGGRIYVAGGRGVRAVGPGAGARWEMGAAPRCIAVDACGTVYAGMTDHVEVFGPDGKRRAAWPASASNALLTAVAVASNSVYVADARGREVVQYALDGSVVNRIPGFIVPSPYFDLLVAPDGRLWVVDPGQHRIQTYGADMKEVASWGQPSLDLDGFSGCCNPAYIAMLPNGDLVTSEKGLRRVKVHAPDGKFVCLVAGPDVLGSGETSAGEAIPADGAAESSACPVAVDRAGRVLVLDAHRGEIRVFVPKAPAGPSGAVEVKP